MAPKLKEHLSLRSQRAAHWLTFDLKGDYTYVASAKNSDDGTEIFNASTHTSLGLIGSSEDIIEIDFTNGKISRVGDQYGLGGLHNTKPQAYNEKSLTGRVRRIQCLKLLRRERQRERDGVLLYVRRGAGFRNRNDVTAADGPSQRDGCRRTTARCANLCKRRITQKTRAETAERR